MTNKDALQEVRSMMSDIQKACEVLAIMHEVYAKDPRLDEENKNLHKDAVKLIRYLADVEKEYSRIMGAGES